MPRSSRSMTARASQQENENADTDTKNEDVDDMTVKPTRKRKAVKSTPVKKSPAKKTSKSPPAKKARSPKGKTKDTVKKATMENLPESGTDAEDGEGSKSGTKSPKAKKISPKKKATAADHQRITTRDELTRLWDSSQAPSSSYTYRIASWNVVSVRALLRKDPSVFTNFCKEHNLDMLCLQETKLQEMHLDDPKLNIRGCVEGYDEYWSCSTAKTGYSGTAVFIKQHGKKKKTASAKQTDIGSFFSKKGETPKEDQNAEQKEENSNIDVDLVTPLNVSFDIGQPIDNEGRTVIVDMPFATLTNVYVPNSGQKLERLDYRINEWDKEFLKFQQKKEKDRKLPVIWLGDLNIAHKAYDIWNDGAKHLAKQAGVTEQERISFQSQLDSGYVDAFRKLYPKAKGHYSYWSRRAGNREPNKGLRLDYFVCSPELFNVESAAVVRDSYMIPEQLGSDHAPVVLEIELKGASNST